MASQGGTSRLTQMQMRFQQRQQQEREQRKIEMVGDIVIGKNKIAGTTIDNIEKKTMSSSIGPGKVRQMFDERRQRSTGIDKSYPLKPIAPRSSSNSTLRTTTTTTTTTTTNTAITSTQKQTSTTLKQTNSRASSTSSSSKKSTIQQKNDVINGNTNNHNNNVLELQDSIDNETFPSDARFSPDYEIFDAPISKLPNVGKHATMNKNKTKNGLVNDDKNNNATDVNRNQNNSNLKLKPVVTKKTPPTESLNRTNEKVASSINKNKRSPPPLDMKSTTPTVLSPKTNAKVPSIRVMNTTNKNVKESKDSKDSQRSRTSNSGGTNNNGLPTCRICHRNFNADRLEKHEQICEKTASKKRKKYDALKHRVIGTDAEKYVKKNLKVGSKVSSNTNKLAVNNNNNNNNNNNSKASNWRKTHEDFIKTIRAAKQMQVHLAKGGKLSDLPPPPPSENLDYIQCPHCSRRFNQSAAERHIPKCANFRHNKSKPGGGGGSTSMKKRF